MAQQGYLYYYTLYFLDFSGARNTPPHPSCTAHHWRWPLSPFSRYKHCPQMDLAPPCGSERHKMFCNKLPPASKLKLFSKLANELAMLVSGYATWWQFSQSLWRHSLNFCKFVVFRPRKVFYRQPVLTLLYLTNLDSFTPLKLGELAFDSSRACEEGSVG